MAHKSYWEENKETLVNKALVDYKEKNCPSAGFNIIRYSYKCVISIKPEFQDVAAEMFAKFGFCNDIGNKYVILRLAKLGAIEYNGA